MNTSAGYYQAPRPPRVPLDEVLIKLHPDGFHQEFAADGINVGAGGLSMRASVLPEVGSTLRCHLDNPTGGEAIELIGRVVWAHESGPHIGEFGIRFTHLSDDDQTRIEALIQRWGRATAKAPDQPPAEERLSFAQLDRTWGRPEEEPRPLVAVRRGSLRLLHDPERPEADELYDLAADPGEQNDLARTRPQVLKRLRTGYEA